MGKSKEVGNRGQPSNDDGCHGQHGVGGRIRTRRRANDSRTLLKDERELEREARRIDGEANTRLGEERVLARMASDLDVPVEALKRQRTSGLSLGNLFIANALAKSTGKDFEQILAARRSGKGWSQIARENNTRLGEVVS